MKIIQTNINGVDSQGRIIEVDMTWNDFKDRIYGSIHDGISDVNFPIRRSYPLLMGKMIPKMEQYKINADDEYHLDIGYIPYYTSAVERICFFVLEL